MAAEKKRARRIAVISGKGGVGKTVITANLAGRLSSIGRKILVIDADLGLANLDVILGVAPEFTFQDAIRGTHTLDEVLFPTPGGFDLIPAGSGIPEGAALSKVVSEGFESLLSSLEDRYDAILFDAGAGIGDVVLFFTGLADEILLIVTPEPTSLMDAYASIKVLNQVQGKTDFWLVVNQANPDCPDKTGESIANHLKTVAEKFMDSKDHPPVRIELIGSIPSDPTIPRSIRQRKLLMATSPEAPSANLMNHIAGFFNTRIA